MTKSKKNQNLRKQQKILSEEQNRISRRMQLPMEEGDFQGSTFLDFATVWLKLKKESVKPSTYSNYYYYVNKHILPFLGDLQLSEMQGTEILNFIDCLQEKLSANTIRTILITLRTILKQGVKAGLFKSSLPDYCRINYHRQEAATIQQDDSIKLKNYLLEKEDVFSMGILLCRSTGIRIGELCGLKWGDIDFEKEVFYIRRTVSRIKNPNSEEGQPKTILYIRSPKSFTSIREIPIPQYLYQMLKKLQMEDDIFLLTGTKNCTEPRNIQKRFKHLLKECDIQEYNFHAMRHSFASACLQKGNDCKTVSAILGHASTKTTWDIYMHTSMCQKQDCINSIS